MVYKITSANTDLFKINNRNVKKTCEICLKLAIKISKQRLYDVTSIHSESARNLWLSDVFRRYRNDIVLVFLL